MRKKGIFLEVARQYYRQRVHETTEKTKIPDYNVLQLSAEETEWQLYAFFKAQGIVHSLGEILLSVPHPSLYVSNKKPKHWKG